MPRAEKLVPKRGEFLAKSQSFLVFPAAGGGEENPPRGAGQVRLVTELAAPRGRGMRGAAFPALRGESARTVSLCPPLPAGGEDAEKCFFGYFGAARNAFDGAELILRPPETALSRADVSRRGVRGLLRDKPLFEAFFRAAYRTSALARVAILLPFVSDPGEADAVRLCASRALRTLLYRREPFDETILIGIRLETPAAVLCGRRLVEDWDFTVTDTDALAEFVLALPKGERPGACGAEILLRFTENSLETAHGCGRFCGIAGFLTADAAARQSLIAAGADMLFLPASRLPLRGG